MPGIGGEAFIVSNIIRIKTNYGVMVAELCPDKAPETVVNFLRYVRSGFL